MLDRFFRLKESGTTIRREIVAGMTTFMTMAYIIVVNPGILKNAFPEPDAVAGPLMVATIPPHAYGPALIIVGLLMLQPITRIKFGDYTELISGRAREVHPGLWLLGILSLLFFIFYPYG